MSCSSGLNSITAAKSSAVLQRSSHSSLWRRLFWRQLPLTFCANRLEPSASILRSLYPQKRTCHFHCRMSAPENRTALLEMAEVWLELAHAALPRPTNQSGQTAPSSDQLQ